MPRFYCITELPHSNLAPVDSLHVTAFASRAARDAYVADEDGQYLDGIRTSGSVRRAATRAEAARACREIMEDAFGGRQSGYHGLREVGLDSLAGLRR